MRTLLIVTIFWIITKTQSVDYTKCRQNITNIIRRTEIREENDESDEDSLEIDDTNWELEIMPIQQIARIKCSQRVIQRMEREGLQQFFPRHFNLFALIKPLCRYIFIY